MISRPYSIATDRFRNFEIFSFRWPEIDFWNLECERLKCAFLLIRGRWTREKYWFRSKTSPKALNLARCPPLIIMIIYLHQKWRVCLFVCVIWRNNEWMWEVDDHDWNSQSNIGDKLDAWCQKLSSQFLQKICLDIVNDIIKEVRRAL